MVKSLPKNNPQKKEPHIKVFKYIFILFWGGSVPLNQQWFEMTAFPSKAGPAGCSLLHEHVSDFQV